VIIPGDLETDADVLPLLLPEAGVSDPIHFGHEILNKDVSNLSHQEVDKNISEVWEEQNTRNGDDLGSIGCVNSISLTALSPFKTIEGSLLSLSLVSSANKYCEFHHTSTPEFLQLTFIFVSFIGLVAWLDAQVIIGCKPHRCATMVCTFCMQSSTP
jgi:hypothetical protein